MTIPLLPFVLDGPLFLAWLSRSHSFSPEKLRRCS